MVLGLIAIVWIWTIHSKHRTEHRLAGVASELAGRPVGVRCQGFFAELVDITSRDSKLFLTRGSGQLKHFLGSHSHHDPGLPDDDRDGGRGRSRPAGSARARPRADAEAITTLAHESMHLRGIQSESEAT